MTAQLSPVPVQKFFDANGFPLYLGTLTTYAAGTTNPQATYIDSTQSTPNTNPINLNFRGECNLWLDPTLSYKMVLKDVFGNTIWTVDNIPGGFGALPISTSLIPNPTNTRTLGNSSFSWANIYLGANAAPAYDTASGNIGFYARTAAEIAAGVTPVNYAYAPGPTIDIRRFGYVADGVTNNNAALTAALAVSAVAGVATTIVFPPGQGNFSGTFVIPSYTTLQGQGVQTVLKYTGSGSFLTMNSTTSRAQLRQMQVVGTSQTGVGLTLGDSSGNAAFTSLDHVLFTGWATAMRIGGATWLSCTKCEFGNPAGGSGTLIVTNNVGIDFNAFVGGSTNYTSAVSFYDCIVSNNSLKGVTGTSVPVFMNAIAWYNCNVQNNCQGAPSNPQFYMSRAVGFVIDSMYIEFVGSGTVPDAIHIDNHADGTIRNTLIFQSTNGIVDGLGGGTVTNVEIVGCSITASTNAINLPNETSVIVRSTGVNGAVSLSGSGCTYLTSSSGMSSWPTDETGFSPALAFGGGSITQTVAAANWSQVGHVATLNCRINWSAIAAPTGNVTVTGIPKAPLNDAVCVLYYSGLTVANGSLVLEIPAGSTTGTIYNIQSTTAALQGGALAASGAIIISGSYQV